MLQEPDGELVRCEQRARACQGRPMAQTLLIALPERVRSCYFGSRGEDSSLFDEEWWA
jgi:hypothetical protein